jgi:membrane-bound lytic murein transglycosylase D
MRRLILALATLIAYNSTLDVSISFAAPAFSQQLTTQTADRVFFVPQELRGRVDFWKDVFTRYGKYQQIIHHREFPQVRFGVIDLSQEGQEMNPVEFERFKKAESDRRVREVYGALENLAQGKRPANLLEDIVAREMKSISGGREKYRRAIEEDLVRTQTGIKERYAEAVKRAGRYMPILEQIFVEEYGLPIELTRLPFVESSFDYTAYSSVGAAGIWQFMPRTGKSFGMTVNSLVDERRDPITATHGAAKYLKIAYQELGNWPLALTSYNHGVGGVRKKVREFGTSDIVRLIEHPSERAFGFASSNFYPEFLAAVEIYRDWKVLFPGLEIDPPLNLKTYPITSAIGVNAVANKLGVDVEALRGVNYALSKSIWTGRVAIPRGYDLRVPQGDTINIARERGVIEDPEPQPKGPSSSTVYSGSTYKVRSGDTLVSIAKKFNVSVAAIKEQNSINSSKVFPGQNLVIQPSPKLAKANTTKQKTRAASVVRESTYHTVSKGDTLGAIAKKYSISVQALKNQNGLRSNKIAIGQKLKVP